MQLVEPSEKYYASYLEAIEEYQQNHVDTFAFIGMTRDNVFEYMKDSKDGSKLPEGYVPATYFWAVEGDKFVGEISIRHRLTNALLRFGGNIGYGVRYSKYNQGIGTKMLGLALEYAKNELGLTWVLITCNDDNYGSARVIEKNGGILIDKIQNTVDGKVRITRRYKITLSE